MRSNHLWIGGIGIFALLALPPVISSGVPPARKANKQPSATVKVLYSFTGGSDGGTPLSDLTLDSAGNLYGTTSAGGTGSACQGGCGTVFELKHSANGWKEQVLYSFKGGTDGASPQAGVIFDSAGNLYGTTNFTVFKLAPNSKGGWRESVIYGFSCQSDGCLPQTDLVFDTQGNLFGTAQRGGIQASKCDALDEVGCGTVFELMPQSNGSWKETTIYEFAGAPDGGQPSSAVVLDSLGNVYGTTGLGGTGKCTFSSLFPGCGIVYKLTPSAGGKWTESVLYDFVRGGGFGIYPSGGLILDNASHLLGATVAGGNGLGTVFELKQTQKGWVQTVVYRFYGNPDGAAPEGKVAMNSAGTLFGMTLGGGANHGGTVFALTPSMTNGWRESVISAFPKGSFLEEIPSGQGVVLDSNGHLYGTTSAGGTINSGSVYEVTP
jgi:uncharacterized repeat protein (TIGR03803 family)